MLNGLWKLTWLEIKIFLREPMGAFGTIVMPVVIFLAVGRTARAFSRAPEAMRGFLESDLPVLVQ
jgi:ABC-2 type transport system permease protein